MNFLEITRRFEEKIEPNFKVELLELHYVPHAFGSGSKAYRINGRNIQIIFDGRDRLIEIKVSERYEKYDNGHWTDLFHGTIEDFEKEGIEALSNKLNE